MDYLADLTVKESCSILEQTTPTKNGGTASCRSAVFFGSEEEDERERERKSGRMGKDYEMMEEDGNWNRGGGERTWRGRKRNWRTATGLGEDGNGTLRRKKPLL